MTNSRQFFSVIVVLTMGTTIAMAQDERRPRTPTPSFTDLDSSNDGVLSREEFDEWVATAAERRAQRGGSGEGRPTPRAGGREGADVFSRIDSDGDGNVSETEFTAMVDGMRSRRGEGRPSRPNSTTDSGDAT